MQRRASMDSATVGRAPKAPAALLWRPRHRSHSTAILPGAAIPAVHRQDGQSALARSRWLWERRAIPVTCQSAHLRSPGRARWSLQARVGRQPRACVAACACGLRAAELDHPVIMRRTVPGAPVTCLRGGRSCASTRAGPPTPLRARTTKARFCQLFWASSDAEVAV